MYNARYDIFVNHYILARLGTFVQIALRRVKLKCFFVGSESKKGMKKSASAPSLLNNSTALVEKSKPIAAMVVRGRNKKTTSEKYRNAVKLHALPPPSAMTWIFDEPQLQQQARMSSLSSSIEIVAQSVNYVPFTRAVSCGAGSVWGKGYDVKDWATCIATAPELTHREDSECSCGDEKEEEEKSHCSANGTSGRFNNRRRKSREV
jgi:hypothetical protein